MNLDPRTLAVERTADDEVRIRLAVPAQLPCFADHFPGAPMLPGVLQLGWAVRLAQQQFGIELPLQQVAQLKFQHPILPDRSEEHTSELQSLMRISYAVFCLKKKITTNIPDEETSH